MSDLVVHIFFQIAAGFGYGAEGSQIVPFESVSRNTGSSSVDTGHDPLGLKLLQHFTSKIVYNLYKIGPS